MNRIGIACGLLFLFPIASFAQEGSEDALNVMRQRALALQISDSGGATLKTASEPILRYNDIPRRINDASVWRIGEEGRPRAILVLEIYRPRSIQYEFTAVADPPKSVQTAGWSWSPKRETYQWLRIPVDEIPKEGRLRQHQLRKLSRQFTAAEEFRGETYHLRLMPRPLYEYSDEQDDILEGAVFAWAHGTNVEVLMFLELREQDDQPVWVAGFSRLGSASLNIRFQDKGFWTAPEHYRPTMQDRYVYRMDSLSSQERAAFDSE